MLKISQRRKLEHQKRELQTGRDEDKNVDKKKSLWKTPQEKANFNRNMRQKLKEGLRGLSDMVLLLEGLPPNVLDNAKLLEDLPKITKFVEIFLEKADLLPVAEHESGEIRTFRNYAVSMENNPNADAFKNYIKMVEGKPYLIESIHVTASPSERYNFDVLQNHVEYLRRYIDPCIIIIDDKYFRKPSNIRYIHDEIEIKRNMMGECVAHAQLIEENIPTKPPCKPTVLVDGKLHEIPIAEKGTSEISEK